MHRAVSAGAYYPLHAPCPAGSGALSWCLPCGRSGTHQARGEDLDPASENAKDQEEDEACNG